MSLGSSIQPSNVLEVIEKTQAALEETSIDLAFVEEQVEQEEAIVGAIEERRCHGDPVVQLPAAARNRD